MEPVAVFFAVLFFHARHLGTGWLAILVLAGSAAYTVGEMRGWTSGLENNPWEAIGYDEVIGAVW